MGLPRATKLSAGDSADPSLSAAAPAAGGRGIDGSRCVYSLGVCGVLAGGAAEVAAWPEWLLAAAVPSSAVGSPVEARGGSVALCAPAALRSRSARPPEPPSVTAVVAPCWGVLPPPLRRVEQLLVKTCRSLQASSSPSSVDAVGFAEDGWRFRSRLRRETAKALWRRLGADVLSTLRFCCLRQMVPAAFQQGWSRRLLGCVVCVVVLCLPCVGWIFLLFVRVCALCS